MHLTPRNPKSARDDSRTLASPHMTPTHSSVTSESPCLRETRCMMLASMATLEVPRPNTTLYASCSKELQTVGKAARGEDFTSIENGSIRMRRHWHPKLGRRSPMIRAEVGVSLNENSLPVCVWENKASPHTCWPRRARKGI